MDQFIFLERNNITGQHYPRDFHKHHLSNSHSPWVAVIAPFIPLVRNWGWERLSGWPSQGGASLGLTPAIWLHMDRKHQLTQLAVSVK